MASAPFMGQFATSGHSHGNFTCPNLRKLQHWW